MSEFCPQYLKRFNSAECGVQVKCSSTSREVQTGHFTKVATTMTELVTKDASTQKKLRKAKQRNFLAQFSGFKKTITTQFPESGSRATTATQWSEDDVNRTISDLSKVCLN